MSINYYKLKPPITKLSIYHEEDFDRIVIWIDHCSSGHILIEKEQTRQVLRIFTVYEENRICPLRTYWGGPERGMVVVVNNTLPDETFVISEYGEILTVAEVKAQDGTKRKDDLPIELFGQEKNDA